MNPSRRVLKVEKEVLQIVARFLVHGISDPLHGMVTVSRVAVSGDLRTAKVFVSMLSTEPEKKINMQILEDCRGEVQHAVSQQLNIKFVPKVSFVLDRGLENAMKVEEILKNLKVHE